MGRRKKDAVTTTRPVSYPNISTRITYPDTWPEGQQRKLDQLFEQARQEGLWFHSDTLAGEFWFTPDELQKEHEANKFLWVASNWVLRSPVEAYQQAANRAQDAAMARQAIAIKIARERKSRKIEA